MRGRQPWAGRSLRSSPCTPASLGKGPGFSQNCPNSCFKGIVSFFLKEGQKGSSPGQWVPEWKQLAISSWLQEREMELHIQPPLILSAA